MTQTSFPFATDTQDLLEVVQEIVRLRDAEDIPDFINLDQRFVAGRATNRVPSSPSDVVATDNVGDIVNNTTHEFKLVNISGTGLRWDRRALDTSW